MEWQRRLDAPDLGLVERPAESVDRGIPVRGVDHQLRDQVVVLRRDPISVADPAVHPDPRPGRHRPQRDPARGRGEIDRAGSRPRYGPRSRDRRDPRLARGGQGSLRQRQTGSQPELLADKVEAGDQLGHAVLHLESGVDLEEGEAAVRSEQELGRGRVAQAAASPRRTAIACRSRRSSGVSPGAGASSTSFWWRRWSEQSRSPSATTRPVASPSSCTSTWRAPAGSPARGRRHRRRRPRAPRRTRRRAPPAGRRMGDPAHAPTAAAGRCLDQQREPNAAASRRRPQASGRSTATGSSVPGTTGTSTECAEPARMQLVAEGVESPRAAARRTRARPPPPRARTLPARTRKP